MTGTDTATDALAWLAEPQSIAWGGYGIVIARDLASETLASRVADTAHRPREKRGHRAVLRSHPAPEADPGRNPPHAPAAVATATRDETPDG